jgi:1-phosphofructokinase family hexose kinase
MILTVVPNPSLDKTVLVPGFEAGKMYRPDEVLTLAGGKGFNFARALHVLGQRSLVTGPIGGSTGKYLLALAARDGLECDPLVVSTEVRSCLTIVDRAANNRLTELYERGVALKEGEWERLVELAASHFAEANFLAVCGSFPSGVPARGLYDLVLKAQVAGLSVLLDTSGPQLEGVLELGPALLKINQFEAGELTGRTIVTPGQAIEAAVDLQKRGVQAVVVTLGAKGAVGLTSEGQSFGWRAPEVAAISATGSGDSLLAGIAASLERSQHLREAVRLGVAAGAANTLQIGAGRLELDQVQRLVQLVQPLTLDGTDQAGRSGASA